MSNFKLSDVPGQLLIRGCRPEHTPTKKVLKEGLEEIKKSLGIAKLNLLQEKILFATLHELHVFVVGPKGIGKTTAYLIPILIHLYEQLNNNFSTELQTGSPMAVICCPSTERGVYLQALLQSIEFLQLSNGKSSIILLDTINSSEYEIKELLSNQIYILILTGSFLISALKSRLRPKLDYYGINFLRMKFLVVEELVMKHDVYSNEPDYFLKYLGCHLGIPWENFQVISSGTVWTAKTEEFYKSSFDTPLKRPSRKTCLIFASAFQALYYSCVPWIVVHCDTQFNKKFDKLVAICKSLHIETPNIVVACGSRETARCISKHLSKNADIGNTLVVSGLNGVYHGLFRERKDWNGTVHVVSDDSLDLLHVDDVTHLIHFDIDSDVTWGTEGDAICSQRFACIWDKLGRTRVTQKTPTIYVLTTGEEHNFLPLYKSLKDIQIEIPSSLEKITEKQIKRLSDNLPLCPVIKCFGCCSKIECNNRHEIIEDDLNIEADGPPEGEIKFKVIQCLNPSHYHVKLLRHYMYDENGDRHCVKIYRDELLTRLEVLRKYYDCLENINHPLIISVGEKFCIQSSKSKPGLEMYFRVQITKILKVKNGKSMSRSAEVLCLDTGTISHIPTERLLILPKEFQNWSNLCAQIILTNLLPPIDACNEYFAKALVVAKELTEGRIWCGKILLSMRDTIWVNPIIQSVYNPETGQIEIGLNLGLELTRRKYAEIKEHYGHMVHLLSLIRKVDPKFPDKWTDFQTMEVEDGTNLGSVDTTTLHKLGDPVEWATIQLTDIETPKVRKLKIHSWVDPWEIYGMLVDNGESPVQQLELALTETIENNVMPRSDESMMRTMTHELKLGSIVAVKGGEDVRNRWQRGMIVEEEEEDNVPYSFNIFLVDYGITKSEKVEDVLPLCNQFVEMVPFQAVCLKLAHVRPISPNGMWRDKDVGALGRLLQSSDTYVNVIVYGMVPDTEHPCNFYEAFAIQCNGGTHNNLNNCIGLQLVRDGYAHINPSYQEIISKFENVQTEPMDSVQFNTPYKEISNTVRTDLEDLINSNLEGDYSDDLIEMCERFQMNASLQDEELPGPPIKDLNEGVRTLLVGSPDYGDHAHGQEIYTADDDGETSSDDEEIYFDANSSDESEVSNENQDSNIMKATLLSSIKKLADNFLYRWIAK